ncbi:DUF531 domain-containing protein [Thermococcus barophilus]|uniref:DUF531 domain-containing protein n=2 Tax=Thermococcus barophilus TaxID=55802 RepID=A0A0S1XDX9_THEBA|nr:DUF531 domain-containing protein [Thermococcus barophilus]ADT84760.1 hypothetical protein TERMP_01785 [Thermococcus barophilus MP]ALM75973.1 hypothetical protein TBCH5v1_2071 [Thermococcus barophilus]
MLTLALYNSYDPKKVHEAHLRAIARAAPICYAFDFHLALIGFPFNEKPLDLSEKISENTTIGEGGKYLLELAKKNKFHLLEFPKRGFPPQFGTIIATTRKPDEHKEISAIEVAKRALKGESFMLIVGLGRHGLPEEIFKLAEYHLDITDGKRISLETCTAIGSIPTKIRTLMEALKWKKR